MKDFILEKLPGTKADYNYRLPTEYKQLESRVDALRDVHTKLLKVTKVHETESVRLFHFPKTASCGETRCLVGCLLHAICLR